MRSASAVDAGLELHPSPAIRCRSIDGLIVILSLQSGSYYILDEAATALWQACTQDGYEEAALDHLARRFEVEPGRLKTDFASFKRECVEKGFLVPTGWARPTEKIPSTRVVIPVWHAWLCIIRTAISLRWRGFGSTYANYARLANCRERTDVDRILPRALRAFLVAENFAISSRAPRDCLRRSLALFRFLRNMRVPVEHCIGIERYPFHAHAWVEHRGEVLLDIDRRAQFVTLARIAA